MAQPTSIEWTDLSWNPVHGCSIVSTECRNCYAMTLSLRYGQTTKPWTPANAAENVILKPHKLREPLSGAKAWRGLGTAAAAAGKTEGKLVFVNSMSDLFHEQVPDEFIAQVFGVMNLARQHTFQILTKRPERMRDLMLKWQGWRSGVFEDDGGTMPLPNVWLGVSVGNRQFVNRAGLLRETPAAVRFISAEPLIGPLLADCQRMAITVAARGESPAVTEARSITAWESAHPVWPDTYQGPELSLRGIDWLICGGESGSGHRPMDVKWARDLRDACMFGRTEDEEHFTGPPPGGTAFFMKQMGGTRPGTRLEDLPADLRIREFPVVGGRP